VSHRRPEMRRRESQPASTHPPRTKRPGPWRARQPPVRHDSGVIQAHEEGARFVRGRRNHAARDARQSRRRDMPQERLRCPRSAEFSQVDLKHAARTEGHEEVPPDEGHITGSEKRGATGAIRFAREGPGVRGPVRDFIERPAIEETDERADAAVVDATREERQTRSPPRPMRGCARRMWEREVRGRRCSGVRRSPPPHRRAPTSAGRCRPRR
jgi:hypothetical protein